jgi:hypothetical protein
MRVVRRSAAALALLLAACGSPTRIRLEPVRVDAVSTCGFPDRADVQFVFATALGDGPADVRNVPLDGAIEFDDFRAGTRQFEVKIVGAGGAVLALGRTAPLDMAALPDGSVVPVLMAPPEDGCPVGGLSTPRDRPIVVAAAGGALVIGGRFDAAAVSGTAEWYDPATGRFEPVETPSGMQGPRGAAEMSAATMPDGRIVLTGGARDIYVVFDPATRTFDPVARALTDTRAMHASVALDDDRVLLAGGCELDEDTGLCTVDGPLLTTKILHVSSGATEDGPELSVARLRGTAWREAAVADASDVRVLLVGGTDAGGAAAPAERIDPARLPGTGPGELVTFDGSMVAPLAAGSLFAGFAPLGATPDGSHDVAVPGIDTGRFPGNAPAREAPLLTTLEDGGVLVVGGDLGVTSIARYHADTGDVTLLPLAAAPDGLDGVIGEGAGAALLPDGTVLIAGGHHAGGDPRTTAAVFRPAGDSPFAGGVTVTPGGGDPGGLVALDPATVSFTDEYVIGSSSGELARWVVVPAIRPRELDLTATLFVEFGVAILLGMSDAEHFDAIELRSNNRVAQLVRRDGGEPQVLCSGTEEVRAIDLIPEPVGGNAVPTHLSVRLRDGTMEVRLGRDLPGTLVLECPLADARAGLVGIGSLGTDAEVTLSTISLNR